MVTSEWNSGGGSNGGGRERGQIGRKRRRESDRKFRMDSLEFEVHEKAKS